MSAINIKKIKKIDSADNLVFLVNDIKAIGKGLLSEKESIYALQKIHDEASLIHINRLEKNIWIFIFKNQDQDAYKNLETCRRAGNDIGIKAIGLKIENLQIADYLDNFDNTYAFIEGMALGSYMFNKYKKESRHKLGILVFSNSFKNESVIELSNLISAVFKCKDLVNEPYSYLTTSKFAEEIQTMAKESGLKINILNKLKIASLKMGGLLAVNKGSNEPPFFAITEWKPQNAINKKPYIIVGKGITFDTGGYSIKTALSMEEMKIDMSGAAVTISLLALIAKNKLPVHVIGLMPATDNKISDNALLPGDVITMHNGMSVEVLSTDAEGRLILADALSYAKSYDPELVIDLATLTGSAHLALGKYSIFAAGKNCKGAMCRLLKSGENVYERLVEFPLWDEYAESLQSQIADLKNVGARHAGAIVASKFLENFTDYPWIHLDIAGPAYFNKAWNYHTSGATGIGVRLLYNFFKNINS